MLGVALGAGVPGMQPIGGNVAVNACNEGAWCARASLGLFFVGGYSSSLALEGGHQLGLGKLELTPAVGFGLGHFGAQSMVPMVVGRREALLIRVECTAYLNLGAVNPMLGVSWDAYPGVRGFNINPAQDVGAVLGVSLPWGD